MDKAERHSPYDVMPTTLTIGIQSGMAQKVKVVPSIAPSYIMHGQVPDQARVHVVEHLLDL